MRITGLDIEEGRIGGLKALKADKLGDVVVLAGRNGAGKTRLLNYLTKWSGQAIHPDFPGNTGTPHALLSQFWQLSHLDIFDPSVIAKHTWNTICNEKDFLLREAKAWLRVPYDIAQLKRRLLELHFDSIIQPTIIHFTPKSVSLADPREQTKFDLTRRSNEVRSKLGVEAIEHNALARIQHLVNRYQITSHQNWQFDDAQIEEARIEYEKLQTLVTKFLGEPLKQDQDGDATLFGLSLGSGTFSDGQSILLQLCVAIHSQANDLHNLIIMMDEPENHLHPAAMLDAINVIKKHLTKGQLWIATHSLPLLANFDPDCIWWMDEGTISHAGSNPEIVLQGLLGDAERIEQLENFLGLPAAMAINNFTAQCLQPPSVVMTGSEDKQLVQIRNALADLKPADRPLRVLDVGAGRGRLISSLAATLPDAAQTLDYLAFDPSTTYQKECKDAIARCYAGETEQRWFSSMLDLKAKHSGKSMDVVVLCNVLHEIDPSDWLSGLFGQHGTVGHFLKDNGYLLIVEDTEMRIGEKAHDKGFLVLNAGNLRKLFDVHETDLRFQSEAQQNGRLIATLIPADCVSRATRTTLITTLGQVKHEASEKIKALRKAEDSTAYRSGRKLAFHLQQLANATLTIESLGGSK